MYDQMKYKKECVLCETKIWEMRGVRLRKTKEYHEVDITLNNLSKMTVGVCSKHTKPKKVDLPILMAKIHKGWLEEVAFGIGNAAWVEQVGTHLAATRVL